MRRTLSPHCASPRASAGQPSVTSSPVGSGSNRCGGLDKMAPLTDARCGVIDGNVADCCHSLTQVCVLESAP